MTLSTGFAANPDLLWSAEKLRAALGTPGLSVVDTRQAEHWARVSAVGFAALAPV